MELSVLGMWGPYPARGGACSGYLLSTDETRVVLDLGNGSLSRLALDLKDIDALIISHLHWDHMSDLMVLGYALHQAELSLPLYCPQEPLEQYRLLDYKGVYSHRLIEEGKQVSVGDMEITFHRVSHPIPTYGVRVECRGKTFAYSADTGPTETLGTIANNADLFLCEANLLEHQEAPGHLKAREAAEVARDSHAKVLVLTHVAPINDISSLECEAKAVFRATSVAREEHCYKI